MRRVLFRLRRQIAAHLALLSGPERGESLAETALLLPLLTLVLLGVIDFGRAYYLSIEVTNAAYAGASYGVQNSADITGMQNAATGDAPDVAGITASASYGCVCSQSNASTSGVANCTSPPTCNGAGNTTVTYVTVTTSASYTPIFKWPGFPASISLHGSSTLRAGE